MNRLVYKNHKIFIFNFQFSYSTNDFLNFSLYMYMMHSPEVELTEIFLSNIFNGNGLVPLFIAPDTKDTTRGSINSKF